MQNFMSFSMMNYRSDIKHIFWEIQLIFSIRLKQDFLKTQLHSVNISFITVLPLHWHKFTIRWWYNSKVHKKHTRGEKWSFQILFYPSLFEKHLQTKWQSSSNTLKCCELAVLLTYNTGNELTSGRSGRSNIYYLKCRVVTKNLNPFSLNKHISDMIWYLFILLRKPLCGFLARCDTDSDCSSWPKKQTQPSTTRLTNPSDACEEVGVRPENWQQAEETAFFNCSTTLW